MGRLRAVALALTRRLRGLCPTTVTVSPGLPLSTFDELNLSTNIDTGKRHRSPFFFYSPALHPPSINSSE